MSEREGLLDVMAHWGQTPLTIERARQTDAESLTDVILASDWLTALKADVRKAALEEAAQIAERMYGYNRVQITTAIRAAALGDAPRSQGIPSDFGADAQTAAERRELSAKWDREHPGENSSKSRLS